MLQKSYEIILKLPECYRLLAEFYIEIIHVLYIFVQAIINYFSTILAILMSRNIS